MLVLLMTIALTIPGVATFDVTTNGVTPTAEIETGGLYGSGYDAVETSSKLRRDPGVDRRSEDKVLNPAARSKLESNARDIARNFSLAAWAIRQHLNWVSHFTFSCDTKDRGFNTELEAMVSEWEQNCDIAGRHDHAKFGRIQEALATMLGDSGRLLIDTEDGRIQGIEGDRIRNPQLAMEGSWTHGVRTDAAGAAIEYALHNRRDSGFVFDRNIPAEWLLMRGYYERWDQVRGVSPLSSGLNAMRDVYESNVYALAAMKVNQLWQLAITRSVSEDEDDVDDEDEESEDEESSETDPLEYRNAIDLSRPGIIDMQPGEDAKFLSSQNPSTQFKEFTLLAIMLSLKSLDIPVSFFDEGHTNFFGSRGAWNHYEISADEKRKGNQRVLTREKQWLFALWLRDRKIKKLPAGCSLNRPFWSHVPRGMGWWDKAKEVQGDRAAVRSGFDNPIDACTARNKDFHDNVDRTAAALAYAQEKFAGTGFMLSFDDATQGINTGASAAADDADFKEKDAPPADKKRGNQ